MSAAAEAQDVIDVRPHITMLGNDAAVVIYTLLGRGNCARNRFVRFEIAFNHSTWISALVRINVSRDEGCFEKSISNGLAFLQMDLTDPEFHRLALASGDVMHAEVRQLVADAVKAGELIDVQVERLARALQATLHGSMVGWAIARRGT
jgi:hypothetical protein